MKNIMTWGVTMVKSDMEIRETARLMHTNKIGALPVVECGKVMGMLTGDDVLRSLVQILDEGVISKPARWGSED